MIMSNSNFNTKFLYQLAQAEITNESNSIKTVDANSDILSELPSNLMT